MGSNPSYFSSSGSGKQMIAGASTEAHPVENVSWLDAVQFCNTLSENEGLKPFYQIQAEAATVPSWTGDGYRLPTEAEWEYASGGEPEELGASAWYETNSGNVTHRVGQKRPNLFGLYDMLGNVWEWCWDAYDDGYYEQSPSEDPRSGSAAVLRVCRGAGWSVNPRNCRSAFRGKRVRSGRDRVLGLPRGPRSRLNSRPAVWGFSAILLHTLPMSAQCDYNAIDSSGDRRTLKNP
jgi:formylglycine-generating enzyme required for sulfatase activity